MTIDIDWRAAWIAEQEHRGRSDDATRWDERSANYAKVSGTSSYASTFLDYAGVREGETVLDMGCGSGALALPLAQDGHEVYACDFSRGMLDALMETAFRLGVNEHVHPCCWPGTTIGPRPACPYATLRLPRAPSRRVICKRRLPSSTNMRAGVYASR